MKLHKPEKKCEGHVANILNQQYWQKANRKPYNPSREHSSVHRSGHDLILYCTNWRQFVCKLKLTIIFSKLYKI